MDRRAWKAMMSQQALRIYLNDHLAGAMFGRALVRRAASENPDGELGLFLTGLRQEIEEDHETLKRVMDCVHAPANPAKRLAAVLAERAGRLKLNGSLREYSDLSRLIELDGLAAGIKGKQALWRALGVLNDHRLTSFDFSGLGDRAVQQHDDLERHRRTVAARALG
jgi:hypothetical protein